MTANFSARPGPSRCWTSDVAARRRFLTEVAGFAEAPGLLSHVDELGGFTVAGDTCIAVTLPATAPGALPADWGERPLASIEVDDLEAAAERLRSSGAKLHHRGPLPWGESLLTRDPGGNLVEIVRPREAPATATRPRGPARLTVTLLVVDDPAAALGFYGDVLGLERDLQRASSGLYLNGINWVVYLGDCWLELLNHHDHAVPAAAGEAGAILAAEVDDLDAAIARLSAAGVPAPRLDESFGSFLYAPDGAGGWIELFTRRSPADRAIFVAEHESGPVPSTQR